MRQWCWVWGLLAVSGPAQAADKAGVILGLIEKDNLMGARAKCDKFGASEGDDTPLREACAQAFMEQAEAIDDLKTWAAFRTDWEGTSWAAKAMKFESNMALSDAGYDASEKVYLDIAKTYEGTEAAGFAMERAATAAVAAASTGEEAKAVAERYPEVATDLLVHHLTAFVTADVALTGVTNIKVDPPVIEASEVSWSWAARYGDGRLVGWSDEVKKLLGDAGFDAEAINGQAGDSDAPPYSLCHLPGEDREVGVVLMGGGGMAFLPATYSPGCGPDQPVMPTTAVDGTVVAVGLTDYAILELDAGQGATRNVLSLVQDSPGPLLAKPDQSLVYATLGERAVVFPVNGGDAWISGMPPEEGFALPNEALVFGGDALSPQVGAFLGVGLSADEAPILDKWAGNIPNGGVKVDLRSGSVNDMRKAFDALGVDRSGVSFRKVWMIDLDKDSSAELVAEATVGGQRAVFTYTNVGKRLFGRIFQADGPSGTRTAVAFEKDGHTYLAWTGGDQLELLRSDGIGISYDLL